MDTEGGDERTRARFLLPGGDVASIGGVRGRGRRRSSRTRRQEKRYSVRRGHTSMWCGDWGDMCGVFARIFKVKNHKFLGEEFTQVSKWLRPGHFSVFIYFLQVVYIDYTHCEYGKERIPVSPRRCSGQTSRPMHCEDDKSASDSRFPGHLLPECTIQDNKAHQTFGFLGISPTQTCNPKTYNTATS